MSTAALPDAFLRAISEGFPSDFLTREPGELAEYGRDWTRVHTPAPAAVALPRTTDEVSRLLALCHAHQVAVVPSGGRTGLAAGAVAARGELVLSLQRMNHMGPVDVLGNTVRVQAGAVTEAVHQHCAPYGLTWPVDFASKGSSHVGGNIATNAGGVKVIRYGLTRQWVLGLQVVTAQGQVLELNGALEKNNTGMDLRQLFIGSEGTLGVITEATLKLTRLPGKQEVFLFAVPDVAAVLKLFRDARQAPLLISAYEFFTDKCLARVQRHRKLRSPFEAPSGCYVLLEAEASDAAGVEAWLGSLFERGLVTDGTQAQGASQAAELWALRESISESLSATGLPHKNDISLPIAALEAFCGELDAFFLARYPDWEICLFGHIGDGNLHVNVMKPDAMDKGEFLAHTKPADHDIFALVRKHAGSISAEHGIGLLKKDYLSYTRAPAELELLRALKRTMDPANILNPGKILDP
ncbi:FAD-binding oxidoreductase [Stigmatella aurantiaca]|uniref:Oxidoreductase n=1 Tax=Stigmatella aurantiaca (strain DW4/3-1) TaxID=378806 RepID=Q08P62_STIAD|nr:FAD-binding oxidoreductase [Stigmatella aurantiaca]ADO69233.1 Oxidoreductase, FAD-binding protein [Stigmatella aurantiaca DW4/3-1]EAU62266.1 oxidoreductase [Stigmatella aurantiaca DW4/3-1]